MNEPSHARRLAGRLLGGSLLLGLAIGLYFAYVWAGSSSQAARFAPYGEGMHVSIRLEEAPFTSYVRGHKSWSLWAKRIDLESLPGSALGNIQRATLTDIRSGKLYVPPPDTAPQGPSAKPIPAAATFSKNQPPGAAATDALLSTDDRDPKTPAVAAFHAQRGVYSLGALQSVPPDIALLYEVQWGFQLQGGVDYQMRSGDRLHAKSLTILELINRRTRRTERRVLCDSGAQVTLRGVKVLSNQTRYDPAERTVECLGGVRGTLQEGVVQADRLFWSLKDQTLRCPETSTGTLKGMNFTWNALTVDLKRHLWHANTFQARIRMEEGTLPY